MHRITNLINERSEKTNNRLEFGHWELDTVAGKHHTRFLSESVALNLTIQE